MIQLLAVRQALAAPLFLAPLATLLASSALYAFARHHRNSIDGRWFSVWLLANCVWIGFHTVGLVAFDAGTRVVLDSVELAAIPTAAACWFLFTLAYSGRWRGDRAWVGAVVLVPTGLLVAVVLTNPFHYLLHDVSSVYARNGVAVVGGDPTTSAIWLVLAYVFLLYLAGVAVLLDLVRTTNQLYRDQIAALVAAVLLPLTVAAVTMLAAPLLVVDPTPVAFGISAVPLTYAVFRSEVLGLVPASYRVGEQTALETLDQGVLVRDQDDRVVFVNASAEEILDGPSERVVGRSLDSVFDRSPLEPGRSWSDDAGTAERTDGGVVAGRGTDGSVPETLRDERTGRIYRVYESRSGDANGGAHGGTLFFKDVTEEVRRKQRLLVLNRIVRHNLRNDMNVLRGHVDMLAEQVDDESVTVVDDIASDLVHLGEKAHEMDRVIRESDTRAEPVNVASVVDRVATRMEAETGATVEVWGDVQAWTRTQSDLVESITSNLVELAVRRRRARASTSDRPRSTDVGPDDRYSPDVHQNAATLHATDGAPGAGDVAGSPTVVLTVSAEDDAVELSVEDDGPGLAEEEVQGLLDGEVSALQNGASIGLWVVKWCVDLADATWEIETGEWTRVTVSFPGEADLQTSATGLRPE